MGGLCCIDRHIEKEFDKLDVHHPWKRGTLLLDGAIGEGPIRQDHATYNGIDRILYGNVRRRVGPNQQAVDREASWFLR